MGSFHTLTPRRTARSYVDRSAYVGMVLAGLVIAVVLAVPVLIAWAVIRVARWRAGTADDRVSH
ncbi:hypothetical protein WEI85_38200 [Actinomycetes bacterium KLBMP 9797]